MLHLSQELLPTSAAHSDLLFLFYEIPILISGLLAVVMETQRRRVLGSNDLKFTLGIFTALGVLTPAISLVLSPVPANVSIGLFLAISGSGLAIGLCGGLCYWKLVQDR